MADEARGFEPLVFGLVLDASQALGWRTVVGQLEYATQQDWHVLKLYPSAFLDFRDNQVTEVRIRAAEIEMEFYLDHKFTIFPRMGGSPARKSMHRAVAGIAASMTPPPRPVA